ncbi:MAG: sensor histidine kinase [Vicinamibacterales bacterium]
MFVFFVPLVFFVLLGAASLFARAVLHWGGPPIVAYALTVAAWFFFVALFAVGLRRVGSPVGDIVDAAERVADGDFTARIDSRGPRPIRTVGRAFNTMTERLAAHDRQRRELMAEVAHELRTPLTVIQGKLEGLLDGLYPRDDHHLGNVLDEARVLARLVEDLRTLANAETGVLTLEKEPTDLAMLAGDVVASLSAEAAARQVTVRLEAPPTLPTIVIDPVRVRQVLANLVSNALHFAPAGGRVMVSARADDHDVTMAVADTGVGIRAEDLPKVFDRFYKGDASRGSGLGLTIARRLIEAHGGTIRAESTAGHGATMTFTLPIG